MPARATACPMRCSPAPRSGRSARGCRRSPGRWSPAAGTASRPGSAAWRCSPCSACCSARDLRGAPLPVLGIGPGQLARLRRLLGDPALLRPQGADHDPAARDLDGAAQDPGLRRPGLVGGGPRRRRRADLRRALRLRARRRQGGPVLDRLLAGPDRDGRLLGDARAQHPRFHPLRAQPEGPGRRPGARPAADDGADRAGQRDHHLGDGGDLRPGDLGPGRARRDAGRAVRAARPGRHHDRHRLVQHRRQPGLLGLRFLVALAEADLLPDRRHDHRGRSAC